MTWSISRSGKANDVAGLIKDDPKPNCGEVELRQYDGAKALVLDVLENLDPPDRQVSVSAFGSANGPLSVNVT